MDDAERAAHAPTIGHVTWIRVLPSRRRLQAAPDERLQFAPFHDGAIPPSGRADGGMAAPLKRSSITLSSRIDW